MAQLIEFVKQGEIKMSLFIGQLLNNKRYRVEQQIGKGGFGAVYLAYDTVLKQPCAVKENIDGSLQAQRQFEREALLLARLRHPNLPRVIDHFFIPNQGQYLVMDLVEGQNLAQLLAQRGSALTEQEVLEWISQIGQALNYLHQQQPPIIHRDIKPQNIIVTPSGQAMLVDFGISKVYDTNLTSSGSIRALTPGFAPPEQYGLSRTDARSDIYALGATLYTLLTNQRPPDALMRLLHNKSLTAPRQLNRHISLGVEQAILKALELTTTNRFQSIEELQKDLLPTEQLEVIPPIVTRPFNMSFDGPTAQNEPSGWFNSLGFVGNVSTAYQIRVLPRPDDGKGRCVLFHNPKANPVEFGSLMQRCPAHYLAGQMIRFEGEVRTKDVEQWAGLWLRADGDKLSSLFFDNMHNRPIRGSTSWTKYMIDAQLPQETTWLNYGILLVGRGMMWADNFRLMVWSEEGRWIDV